MTIFAILAVFLTIVTVGLVVGPLLRTGSDPHPIAATVTALAIPATVLVAYLVVSNHDWGAPVASEAAAAAGSIEEAVASLERKLAAAPADEEGWILLGSSYLNLNRPADAVTAYQKALEVSGGRSTAARLGIAEARIVMDPVALTGPVGEEIEVVLAEEPQNPKALWYGGLRSMARGENGEARERWQALLALSPPERVRQVIEGQLAQLEGGVAPPATAAAPADAASAAPSTTGIAVKVALGERVRARVSPSAPLFIFVRDASAAGPPLAVVRRLASDLPLAVTITDADLMLPGRTLASLTGATLVARVANGGDPIARAGDIYGEARWQPGAAATAVDIVIDQVVAP